MAIPDLEFDKGERLAFEKEMLGLYVSDHPLMGLEQSLRNVTDVTIRDLLDSALPAEDVPGTIVAPPEVRRQRRRHDRRRRDRSRRGATPGAARSWRPSCSRTSRRRSR